MPITISIFNESSLSRIPRTLLTKAAEQTFAQHNTSEASVNIILFDNPDIHEMNKQFLNHDYPTDVITFPLNEENENAIEGEIYIGAEIAAIQAQEYGVSFQNELARLVAHGCLHLLGFDDATDELRQQMKVQEDSVLALLF
jgi:rRNA maturation RNase YbeY